MTLLAPRRPEPIITAPPGAQVNVEVEIPEDGKDATFRISVKLSTVEPGKTAVVIPLAPKLPKEPAPLKPLLPPSKPSSRKGNEVLGAIALFMVLIGSSMLAVGLVAVLLFR